MRKSDFEKNGFSMKIVAVRNKKHLQMILVSSLVFFVSWIVPVQVSAQKLTPREIAQKTLPSTVLLIMSNGETEEVKSGSGFFVAEDIVATNFHVIKETTEGYAKIYGQDKIYKVLGIVGTDEKNDLALLKISGIKGKSLGLNTDDSIAIGDEVFAVGNPEGLEGTFSQGIVSSIRKTDKFNLLQITASISEGSSGGAVLNDKGEVVGVAIGAIDSGQSLNFAIPVSFLRSLISNQKPLVPLKDNPIVTDNKTQSDPKNQQEKFNAVTRNNPLIATTYQLPSKTPDVIEENLLGKVKSIKEYEFKPELKFGRWVLVNPIDTRTIVYNSYGYVELFEKTIVPKGGVAFVLRTPTNSVPTKKRKIKRKDIVSISRIIDTCSFDSAKGWGTPFRYNFAFALFGGYGFPDSPFTYREVSIYNFSDSMIEQRILHKCARCGDFTVNEKIFTKYEKDKITEFDSNGKILRIAATQTTGGKNYEYRYNAEGKEECRTVEDENGIKEYYNDGELVLKERKKFYTTGTTAITEIWVFNEQKKIFELSEKTTRTETSAGIKQSSGAETTVFDKNTNLIIQFNSDKYEYVFDSNGNWIQKTELKEVKKFGKKYFEPSLVIKRTIAYY